MPNSGMELLRKISLFKDLTPNELEFVHSLAAERRYERGEYIFMEGQERESVYFIRQGHGARTRELHRCYFTRCRSSPRNSNFKPPNFRGLPRQRRSF